MPQSSPLHPMRRTFAALALAALAAALTLAPVSAASAHDYIVDTSPKANSVQSAPISQVKLTFDDVVLDLSGNGSSSLVQVTDPDGAKTHFETGCPTVLGRSVSVPVALGTSGKYLVTWQVVSADGHTVSGTFDFVYQPPAGTNAAAGSSSGPGCGARAGSSAAAPNPGATQRNSSNVPLVIGIASGILGLAVIGVIIVLITSKRKPGGGARWRPNND